MNQDEIRNDFPQLKQGFIYFDSGSTSLKPIPVLNAINNYYETLSASVGRGLHYPSYLATKSYDEAHEKVRKFFNGKGEIIFTENCTETINIIAHGIEWKAGDKIVTTYLEHNVILRAMNPAHQRRVGMNIFSELSFFILTNFDI